MIDDKFIIVPCTSVDNRMNNIVDPVFFHFFICKIQDCYEGMSDAALILMSIFADPIKNKEGIADLSDSISMDIDYLTEILEFLLKEGVVIALTNTEEEKWDQEKVEQELEEEEEILNEAVIELHKKVYDEKS